MKGSYSKYIHARNVLGGYLSTKILLLFIIPAQLFSQFSNNIDSDLDATVFGQYEFENKKYEANKSKYKWLNHFCNYYLYYQQDSISNIIIGPKFDFSLTNQGWENTRGLVLEGKIQNKLSFYSDFRESQSKPFDYVSEFVDSTGVYPSLGRVRPFNEDGYDYSRSQAYLVYDINPVFKINLGYGNNFIGNGFRSLFLDRTNYSYPFVKISTNLKRFNYYNLYTKFSSLEHKMSPTSGYAAKFGTFQCLEVDLTKKLKVGLFQGIIQGEDSIYVRSSIDFSYLNPIIFLRPVEYALGSPDNAIVGLFANLLLGEKTLLYGQLMIDDINISKTMEGRGFFQNKNGFQLGVKYLNQGEHWTYRFGSEVNYVRPFSYAHKYNIQNYTHLGEALAHQLGANFIENVSWFGIDYKRFEGSLIATYYVQGVDQNGDSYGSNIFISDFQSIYGEHSFGNSFLQGKRKEVLLVKLSGAFMISRQNKLKAGAFIMPRMLNGNTTLYSGVFLRSHISGLNELF